MKNMNTCSKCNSRNIVKIPGKFGAYGSGNTMKLKLFIIICFLTLIFTAGCSSTEMGKTKELKAVKSNLLTLETVVDLSKKQDKLSWEDFKSYESKDIGSGLYIKWYPIDNKYELLIGGGSLTEKPMYINLFNKTTQKSIDIRREDVAKFINTKP